jgi:hypothetical protein
MSATIRKATLVTLLLLLAVPLYAETMGTNPKPKSKVVVASLSTLRIVLSLMGL